MGQAAARLCDGRGARRIAAELDPPMSKADRPVRLRRACMDDAGAILAWQRIPGMRRHFRNPRPPSEAEHLRWMRNYLDDPAGNLTIIQHGTDDVGLLRLDGAADGNRMQVSILVAPETQGTGVGTAALGIAREIWPEVELTAEVLPGNCASRAMFQRAGYSWTGEAFRYPPLAGIARDAGRAGNPR